MIALSRLKKAIEDVPTGGMQTGDPKVRLKLCDAQRLEVEFNAIIAERDAALAQVEHLKNCFIALTHADETGYVDDLGFVESFDLIKEQTDEIVVTHDAEVAAKAAKESFDSFAAYLYSVNGGNEGRVAKWCEGYVAQLRAGKVGG